MFYYKITDQGKFKEISKENANANYSILEDYEVKKIEAIFKEYDIAQNSGAYDKMLSAIHELYVTSSIPSVDYYRLAKAVIDGGFAMEARIDEPKYYVHVPASDDDSYLKIYRRPEFKTESIFFYGKEEDYGEQTRFTREEIEKMKQDTRFKGIDFDNCLELAQ